MRLTPLVKNLLILNIAFYIVVQLDTMYGASVYGGTQGYFGLADLLALHYPTSPQFKPVQIVTHFFMHGSLMHIFFNMFALYMFGPPLETMWGPKRFLIFYIACAFGSFLLHWGYMWWDLDQLQAMIDQFLTDPNAVAYKELVEPVAGQLRKPIANMPPMEAANLVLNNIQEGNAAYLPAETKPVLDAVYGAYRDIAMVGASGAIFGLLLAFGMYFPDFKLMLIFLPIPIKARYFIPILIAVEIFLGFQKYSWDNIAHFAHLGGALVGFLLILYWRKFDPPVGKRWG